MQHQNVSSFPHFAPQQENQVGRVGRTSGKNCGDDEGFFLALLDFWTRGISLFSINN